MRGRTVLPGSRRAREVAGQTSRPQILREYGHIAVHPPFEAARLAAGVPVDEDVHRLHCRRPHARLHLPHVHLHVPVVLAAINKDVVLVVDLRRVPLRAEHLVAVRLRRDLPAAQAVPRRAHVEHVQDVRARGAVWQRLHAGDTRMLHDLVVPAQPARHAVLEHRAGERAHGAPRKPLAALRHVRAVVVAHGIRAVVVHDECELRVPLRVREVVREPRVLARAGVEVVRACRRKPPLVRGAARVAEQVDVRVPLHVVVVAVVRVEEDERHGAVVHAVEHLAAVARVHVRVVNAVRLHLEVREVFLQRHLAARRILAVDVASRGLRRAVPQVVVSDGGEDRYGAGRVVVRARVVLPELVPVPLLAARGREVARDHEEIRGALDHAHDVGGVARRLVHVVLRHAVRTRRPLARRARHRVGDDHRVRHVPCLVFPGRFRLGLAVVVVDEAHGRALARRRAERVRILGPSRKRDRVAVRRPRFKARDAVPVLVLDAVHGRVGARGHVVRERRRPRPHDGLRPCRAAGRRPP